MHERYLTAHAPDSVIFPFLHGLEGNNDAQNAFFIGTRGQLMCQEEGSDEEQDDEAEKRRYLRMMALVRVPRFRGLVWVASDEDDVEEYERNVHTQGQLFQEYMDAYQRIAASYEREGRLASLPSPIAVYFGYADSDVDPDEDEDEDDDSEDDYSTSDEDGYGMNLDIDVDVVGMDVDEEDVGRAVGVNLAEHDEGAHMHPVNTRNPAGTGAGAHARPALSAIDTAGVGKGEFWSFLLSWKVLFVSAPLSHLVVDDFCFVLGFGLSACSPSRALLASCTPYSVLSPRAFISALSCQSNSLIRVDTTTHIVHTAFRRLPTLSILHLRRAIRHASCGWPSKEKALTSSSLPTTLVLRTGRRSMALLFGFHLLLHTHSDTNRHTRSAE